MSAVPLCRCAGELSEKCSSVVYVSCVCVSVCMYMNTNFCSSLTHQMCYTRPVESIENKLRCKHHLSRRNRKCLQNYIVCESKKIIIKLYRVIDCIEN